MVEFLATNTFARIVALLFIFALTLGVTMLGAMAVVRRLEIRRELRILGSGPKFTESYGGLRRNQESAWTRLADRIEQVGLNLSDTRGDELRDKLVAAGYDSPAAPRIFTLVRLIMIFAVPGIFLLLIGKSLGGVGSYKVYMYGGVLALLGLYLPNLFVTARADRRREELRHGFPDCLDLMLICIEAGLALEAALDRVGREMIDSQPLVSRLLMSATLQLRAGSSREAALRQMGETSGVEEVRSFATLLVQSDKLGTSIASALRIYAAEMREKRRLRAEEKAHRLPVIISIPLVVCMLPTMIGVLLIPGIVRVVRDLLPAMGG